MELATDVHGCTRTGKFKVRKRGGWEVRKMGSEWKLKVEDPPFFWRTKSKKLLLYKMSTTIDDTWRVTAYSDPISRNIQESFT